MFLEISEGGFPEEDNNHINFVRPHDEMTNDKRLPLSFCQKDITEEVVKRKSTWFRLTRQKYIEINIKSALLTFWFCIRNRFLTVKFLVNHSQLKTRNLEENRRRKSRKLDIWWLRRGQNSSCLLLNNLKSKNELLLFLHM